ncbi:Nucleoside-diphosphate-sugar epimerase [Pedobacter steynii]|uniref:Nucleoside-diphosphate-sugar epimerase n=1 Tax=Pedobacter steynii TaxID=430522 RepID=A0A1G9WJ60_9SPHI|nr:NAD-dependent epimerase/dehydratase family protein [Pedobacter steynii]NQX40315.1 NAD-dependent epimerase/dehydratase family protein [Pedobacter steynii]SDM84622.1 Nucleoside-diphosphate-sugar epimerase [Pedobacter steynii]
MVSVSVTGGNGFVGRNLVPYLKSNGFDLNIINRDQLNNINTDVIGHCDVIVHLAGKAHDLRKTQEPDEYYSVNFDLTKKLYDAFLKSYATKFIFISSVKSGADLVEGILKETDIPDPKTDYGKSKLMAETYIQQQDLPEGKSYIILRPCMIHGPGNKGNLNLLYKVVQKGLPYPLASFENKRSFLSIANLNLIIGKIIACHDLNSGIYNVADDEPLSTNEVIRLIAHSIGIKARLWKINPKLITFVARIGDLLHLPLNSDSLRKLTETYVVSNDKIKKALALKRLPLSSSEGLSVTIKSFDSQY